MSLGALGALLAGLNIDQILSYAYGDADEYPPGSIAPPRARECQNPRPHLCRYQRTFDAEGAVMIVVCAALEFPARQARKHDQNVQRFRRVKARSAHGMGNGPSPLRVMVMAYEEEEEDDGWVLTGSGAEVERDGQDEEWESPLVDHGVSG
jgi:hypothetical protein